MSYSYAVTEKAAPSYGRVAAAALMAVSAGACVGVALSPMVNSLYAAPTAVRPVVASQMVATSAPLMQMQAAPEMVQYEQSANEVVVPQATASGSGWAVLSGCSFAAAAALVAMAFRGNRAESSEQMAMLAVFGKKKAASTVTKSSKAAPAQERPLWYPTAQAPEWLDGSLPGDRGFDPLGLSKPTEYLQFDLDGLDQNAPKNVAGGAIGRFQAQADELTQESLVPYSEVFGLQRFRECELIHGRWAMLGVLGVLVAEVVTGVAWQNAGLVEVSGPPTYWGFELPFSGTQVVWTEVLTMGFVEVLRNTELDLNKRCYPGGAFDPLGLASKDEATTFRLQEAELKHGRLAMVAFLGFTFASLNTGLGATQAFNSFVQGFN